MTAEEAVPKTGEKTRSVSQEGLSQYFPRPDKRPLVVLMVLAGDVITIAFVLLWLIRCR
jgi:hypothetical protein